MSHWDRCNALNPLSGETYCNGPVTVLYVRRGEPLVLSSVWGRCEAHKDLFMPHKYLALSEADLAAMEVHDG